jgi:hypothetical protein
MLLIDALENGQTSRGKPQRTIETVLSKIFFFGDRVLKVYKHRKTTDSDTTDQAHRKIFYTSDFNWNRTVAPEIYLSLKGFASSNEFMEVDASIGDDWAIEMLLVDTRANLTHMLKEGKIDETTLSLVAHAIVEKIEFLTNKNRATFDPLFKRNLASAQTQMLEDLREWLQYLEADVPAEFRESLMTTLKKVVKNEAYFQEFLPSSYRIAIDTNDDNILFFENKPTFIDTMPPKQRWCVHDPHLTLIRPTVDVEVLASDSLARNLKIVRESSFGTLPTIALLVYEIHAAGIQWAYRLTLKHSDLAEKYRAYLGVKFEELKKRL